MQKRTFLTDSSPVSIDAPVTLRGLIIINATDKDCIVTADNGDTFPAPALVISTWSLPPTSRVSAKLSAAPTNGKACNVIVTDDATLNSTSQLATLSGSSSTVSADGWNTVAGTFTYASADGHTFVANTPSDLTGVISVGNRVKLTQSAVIAYFIVTAITAGTITLYGGTDYVLANGAISGFNYSSAKTPFGFNASPAKWTETLLDAVDRTQGAPVANTWYNLGGSNLPVPIGVWKLRFQGALGGTKNSTGNYIGGAVSTLNNAISDTDLVVRHDWDNSATSTDHTIDQTPSVEKTITTLVKTPYYVLIASFGGAGTIWLQGATYRPTKVTAECALL